MKAKNLISLFMAALIAGAVSAPAFAADTGRLLIPKAASSPVQQKTEKTTPAASSATKKTSAADKHYKSDVEAELIELMNAERAKKGLGALTYDENLTKAARIRSKELYQSGTFRHKRPNGDDWNTVLIEDVPVKYRSAGENLCAMDTNNPQNHDATDADFYMNEWVNSPEHYENIMRSEFTHVGVGVYVIEKNGRTYGFATTIFAKY